MQKTVINDRMARVRAFRNQSATKSDPHHLGEGCKKYSLLEEDEEEGQRDPEEINSDARRQPVDETFLGGLDADIRGPPNGRRYATETLQISRSRCA